MPVLRPLALAAVLLAAACATPPETNRFAELTFNHLSKLALDVARIQVVDAYEPPLQAPNVEHLVPVKPAAAAARWAKDRLVAAGGDGAAVYTVEQASVTKEELETKGGLEGLLTTEPAERYEARIRVRLTMRGTGDEISVEARRTASIMEGASINERETTWYKLIESTMRDLNGQLEESIRKHLGRYLMQA